MVRISALSSFAVDASDWYVSQRLEARLEKEPGADLKPYRDFYLAHMWERATFYNDLSKQVLGRDVPHAVLVHHNLVNALFLEDLIEMFKSKGWVLSDAALTFKDPVYAAVPQILPAGESVLWALAKETGRFENVLRYPGEDARYEKAKMDELGL